MLEIKREESFFISKDNKIFTTKEEWDKAMFECGRVKQKNK